MMTNDERLCKAREWLAAAKERWAYTQDEIDAHHDEDRPDAWWSSRYNLLDGMQDRINTIYALFPELRDED